MSAISEIDLARALRGLRAESPLVHCLTNNVVTNWTANVLLAAGAAVAMVDNDEEAEGFAGIASGVLVNLGTPYPETVEAMRAAVRGAEQAGTPWVLDPVAAGALPWRTSIARELLETHPPLVIRGNASEILGLAGGAGGRGVDATESTDAALEAAYALARSHQCTVAVSGPVDHITDGVSTATVANGNEMMTKVIGLGCSLGALIAAFLPVTWTSIEAAVAATALLTVAADRAADVSAGPGSLAVALLDQLSLITPEELAAAAELADLDAGDRR